MKLAQIDTAVYYPVTIPSNKKETKFRPFVVREEKALLTAQESEDVGTMLSTLETIVQSCVKDCPKDLTTFDVEWLFLQIRSKSVGEESRVLITCPHCQTVNNISVDITKAKLTNELSERLIKLNPKLVVLMKYPSISSIAQISSLSGEKQVQGALAASIETIYFNKEVMHAADTNIEDVIEFILNRTDEEMMKLVDFVDKVPTVELDAEYECRQCTAENKIKLKSLADFF